MFETMTWDEFNFQQNKWVSRDFPSGYKIPENRLRGYFKFFDTNGDGTLEFLEMWNAIQKSDLIYSQMENYHKAFDLDRDQTVTREELTVSFDKMNEPDAESKADEFLELYSTDSDGESSVFWLVWHRMHAMRSKEIKAYMQQIRETGVIPKPSLAVDANKDGVITSQEVIELYGWTF